jgi:hypothetical protein
LPFIATGEPWRSIVASQLEEDEEDAIASLLGAMPVVEDHRVRIPCATTSFCAKDLLLLCPVSPARLALARYLMVPPL